VYPVTHITVGVGGVWLGERLWRRWRGGAGLPAIDYRFAAVGALVPDIIDKPLARLGVSGFANNGHTIGHTLLVSACIILVGLLLARRGDTRLLGLGFGCITHPLIDPTNTHPGVLFWPLFGTDFPESRQPYRGYFQVPLDILLAATYAMLVWRSAKWRGRARRFLSSGTFPFADDEEKERVPLYAGPR
jgi:membrane-bound metal-dependent hydrolase YbcI (DUF457 family)